jgi:thiol reductant ABC exporter CydD subunit
VKLDRQLLLQAWVARLHLVASVVLGLFAGAAIVGQAWLLSRVISRVFLDGFSLDRVSPWLIALLFLSLLRAGLVWGSEVAASRLAVRVKGQLRERLAAHLLALGPVYARGERSGELINTVVEGIEALDAYLRQYLPQLALAALVPLTVFLFVLPLDWVSALVLLLTAPLIPLFTVLIGNHADALTKRQWASLSRMSAHFLDVLQGLTTLKLLGRSREQARTVDHISDRFRQATMGVLRVAFLSALVLEMVATLSTAVVAVQIGLRLLYGHLSFDQAFFVLILAPEFYLPLRLLGTRFHAGMEGVAAARRIFEVLDTELPTRDARITQVAVMPDTPLVGRTAFLGVNAPHLRFEGVHYTYGDGRCTALENLSFDLAPGSKVALVGPSGAGKSTVAHLLLRFMEPDRGLITVNGEPLCRLSPAAWRQTVAWMPQEPYLFHDTVAQNIRLSRPDATPDQIVWAARQAQAHAFIEALPQGYDTVVGERGARLSGGEGQRIALARAFLKDAPLLILDEATANLDPESEAQVQEALGYLLRGRTALMIAHRLSTVHHADRILVLAGGRLVQEGSHAALVREEGLYRQLLGAYSSGGQLCGVPRGDYLSS